MAKRPRTVARIAHTKQKPKPRYVSKAHQLERDENESTDDAARRRRTVIRKKG